LDVLLVNLLNGLSWGMLLFLISMGLTIIFGVAGVLNFAHGALFMLGAYVAMQVALWTGSFWAGLVVAPLAVAALGGILERALLRPVYGRDISFQLLLTFALLLVLEDGVRLVWGAGYHLVEPPAILDGIVPVAGFGYPVYRLFLVALGPLLGGGLWALFRFTRFGKIIRAAAADREMAAALGIRVPRLFTGVFVFGTALAALGGALAAAHQSVGPAMGERIIIESFIVVVVGGLGSFPGAFVGALLLGLLEAFGTQFVPRAQMAIPYLLLTAILVLRPRGLFGAEP
jgi:branched-chain amino acid transport system permease protein